MPESLLSLIFKFEISSRSRGLEKLSKNLQCPYRDLWYRTTFSADRYLDMFCERIVGVPRRDIILKFGE